MTGDLFSDGFILFFAVILWGIIGYRAGNLAYGRTAGQLRRRAWTALALLVPGTLLALAKPAVSYRLWPGGWSSLHDKMLLDVPLVIVPLAAALLLSAPRLWSVAKTGAPDRKAPADAEMRRAASAPLLVVPLQLTAIGAAIDLYLANFTAVPLPTITVAMPVVVFAAAACALSFRQARRRLRLSNPGWTRPRLPVRALRGFAVLLVAALAVAAWIELGAGGSRLPDRIVMAAGDMDYGGGVMPALHAAPEMSDMTGMNHAAKEGSDAEADGLRAVSVTELTGPQAGEPDKRFTLTAEKTRLKLSSGATVEAWTYNGTAPGPELRVRQGDLVEVKLVNRDIEAGVTLHWHGLDVPNGEDGVAGVTQNSVLPGQTYTYRFRAEQTGTYWYHSHQDSLEGVSKGLFGALIVEPASQQASDAAEAADIAVLAHKWDTAGGSSEALGLSDTLEKRSVAPGTAVTLRLINTETDPVDFRLAGTPFKVTAIDGTDLNGPTDLVGAKLRLAAGGRYDIAFSMPDSPVLLQEEGDRGEAGGLLLSGDGGAELPEAVRGETFDPLAYGSKADTPFDAESDFDRNFELVIDKKLGFYDGGFSYMYTLNGKVFPDTPMFMVREGDLVKTTIVNRSSANHPMHLHGHHMLVLSRNGEPSTGSPWWTDTLNVGPGETYEVAFKADNPGIWMDHCHNLQHASVGMMMHLAYEGVSSPFEMGSGTPNNPE